MQSLIQSIDHHFRGGRQAAMTFLRVLLVIFCGANFGACQEESHVRPIKNEGLLLKDFNFDDEPAITNAFKFYASTGVEADTYVIQNIDSLPVGTNVTQLKAQFATPQEGVQVKVNGVVQVSGVTENDFTNPVIYQANLENGEVQTIKVVINVAQTEHDPAQFILFNGELTEFDFARIAEAFGRQKNKEVAVGVGVIISYLQAPPDQVLAKLNNYLRLSAQYDLPIIVQLDGEQWWDYRSDLWNWWDPNQAGYNPANRENVEWYGWTSDSAVKIGWRNWGRQLRVKPMPNLMSQAYRDACHLEMIRMVDAVKTWWNDLPEDKKYLFAGIKVGWESAIGVNNWYYPNGNDYLTQPEADDPVTGLTTSVLPSRGVQTIGYASVKTAGIASSGILTDTMQAEVVRIHLEDLSRIANEAGIPRARIFTHGGGWKEGEILYTSAINEYACPGWSFYGHAENPTLDVGVMTSLQKNTAPHWAAAEWLLQGNKTKSEWVTALQHTLGEKTRYVCIYNWNSIETNRNAIDAILEMNR